MKHVWLAFSLFSAVFTLSTAASAQSQPRGARVNLYFPELVDGGPTYVPGGPSTQQWQTTFTFVNVGMSGAYVTLRLYDNSGNPLKLDLGMGAASAFTFTVPSNGIQILRSKIASSVVVSGWAYAEADVPVQASVAYRMIVNGVPQQEVTAQPTLPALTYTSAASAFLGVALANPYSDGPTYVLLTLYDSGGKTVGGPLQIVLPALGHASFTLWQEFPSLQTGTSFTGVLYIQGLNPAYPDRFVAWTLNSDASTILSAQPPGDFVWPISHFDRIWQVWCIVLDAASGLDSSFSSPSSVALNILTSQEVNAFALSSGAEVNVSYAVSELINDSDSEMAFALGHMLGHIYQLRNRNQMKYVPGNAEADADQWALAIMLAARYDPYSLPGALAKLAMATNNSQLSTTYDGQTAASATASLNTRLAGSYSAIQTACTTAATTAFSCPNWKAVVHPHLPPSAPLGIRRPLK
jgi:hypothetical protein